MYIWKLIHDQRMPYRDPVKVLTDANEGAIAHQFCGGFAILTLGDLELPPGFKITFATPAHMEIL